jgi:hypothetical protein
MRKKLLGVLALSLLVLGFNGIGNASLTDGLVAYYPFNGNANDESGNGNNGIVHGAKLTADRFENPNSAYSFNGTNQYIEMPTNISATIEANQTLTIGAWVNIFGWWSIENRGWFSIVDKYKSSNDFGWVFYIYTDGVNDQLAFQTDWSTKGTFCTLENNLSKNTWYFVVVTFTQANATFYLNGKRICQTNTNFNLPNTDGSLYVGYSPSGGDDYSNGLIDNIRLYNRVLSDSEIIELYTEQSCYNEGFAAAMAACKANPASCGINVNPGTAVTLTPDLKMHLPNIQYNTILGIMSIWADLAYDPTKTDGTYFKVTGAGTNN